MATVIDAMLYFNEVELFCARYELLKDSVDLFCVFEAGTTFTGLPKPGNFWADLEKMDCKIDRQKVAYLHLKELPDRQTAQGDEGYAYELRMLAGLDPTLAHQWFKEHLSRELLKRNFFSLPDDAVVMISDIDEIPTPAALRLASDMIARDPAAIVSIEMIDFVGSVACDTGKTWEGSFVMTKKKAMSVCLSKVRTLDPLTGQRSYPGVVRIAQGGWHFSSFGGRSTVESKIMAWGHQELNRWDIRFFLGANLSLGKDIFGRDIFLRRRHSGHEKDRPRPEDYFYSGTPYARFICGNANATWKDRLMRGTFVLIQFSRRALGRLGLLNT